MASHPHKKGTLTWDLNALAAAMHLTASEVREYFTDGRRVSFLIERRIARDVLKGSLAASEGAAFDVLDADGRKWECRSVSRGGVYFCPSYMVGSGRSFDPKGFEQKLANIAGYILSDIDSFPSVTYWFVTADVVRGWWTAGLLGENTKVSRSAGVSLLRGTEP